MEKSNNTSTVVKFCFTNFCDTDIDVKDLQIIINSQEVIKSGEFKISGQKVIKISIPLPNAYIFVNNNISITASIPDKTQIAFAAVRDVLDLIKIYVSEDNLQVDLPKAGSDDVRTNDEIMAYLDQDQDSFKAKEKMKSKKKKRFNKTNKVNAVNEEV